MDRTANLEKLTIFIEKMKLTGINIDNNFLEELENVLDECNFSYINSKSDLLQIVENITFDAGPQQIQAAEERDLNVDDFLHVEKRARQSFKCLDKLFNLILQLKLQKHVKLKLLLCPVVILCGKYAGPNVWGNEITQESCKDLQKTIAELLGCEFSEIFNSESRFIENNTLPKSIFCKLQTELRKENWKTFPGAKAAFEWCLLQTKRPAMSDVLNEVLPTSLLFIDDFQIENKLLGIRCLSQIVNNIPRFELLCYGRADVIYNAVVNLRYSREPNVIDEYFILLLSVLQVLEPDLRKPQIDENNTIKGLRTDEVYLQLLSNMEVEDNIQLRQIYAKHLNLFLNRLGLSAVKYLKKTLHVILSYLEIDDISPEQLCRKNCLMALRTLIKFTWPRIPNYLETILKGLFKLLYDINISKENNYSSVLQGDTIGCLLLLRETSEIKFNELTLPLMENCKEYPGIASFAEYINGSRTDQD